MQKHCSEGSRNTDKNNNNNNNKGTLRSFLNLGRQSKTKSAVVTDGKPKRRQFIYSDNVQFSLDLHTTSVVRPHKYCIMELKACALLSNLCKSAILKKSQATRLIISTTVIHLMAAIRILGIIYC